MSTLSLSVNNNLVDIVVVHMDPANAWLVLGNTFQLSNQLQMMTLLSHLQDMDFLSVVPSKIILGK
jgi:hypothetical protein